MNLRRSRSGVWTAALLGLVLGSPVAALEIEVRAPDTGPAASTGDTLVARFTVAGTMDGSEGSALGEGIPATLTLVVDLWRVRSGWWDSLVHTQTLAYRFRRDLLDGRYRVLDPEGRAVGFPDPDALERYLARPHEIVLGPAAGFPAERRYYLTVKAIVRPLRLDDLEEIDAWLNGEVTAGRGGGGILGLPKTLAALMVDLSGLGDRSSVGRSAVFVPNP